MNKYFDTDLSNISDTIVSTLEYYIDSIDAALRPRLREMRSAISTQIRPNCNILDCNNNYQVVVELPGVDPKSISIKFISGHLMIEGEKIDFDDNCKYIHKESRFGKFDRKLFIPFDADHENIKATFTNGLLCIRLDKIDEDGDRIKRIPIE